MSGANARVDGEVVDDDIMVATLNELVNERSMMMTTVVMRKWCVFFSFKKKRKNVFFGEEGQTIIAEIRSVKGPNSCIGILFVY